MRNQSTRPVAWIEKTVTTFAPEYRRAGALSFGAALVAPQRSATGADIYKNMRLVQPGDLILHLVNNEEFMATSLVDATYRSTSAGSAEIYAVPLRDFRYMNPTLKRDTFFAEPYASELRQLIGTHLRGTFFTRDLKFAQGAYLTAVPTRLLDILDSAYKSVAGITISQTRGMLSIETDNRISSAE